MNLHTNPKVNEGINVKGTVIVRSYPAGTLAEAKEMLDSGRDPKRVHEWLISRGKIEAQNNNIVVIGTQRGLDLLVQYLISSYLGTLTYPLGIAYGEIGTGSTAVSSGDTQLTTAYARSTTTYAVDSALTTAIFQFFFPDNVLANQTYPECGSFVGGSSTLGSGQMFNHALFSTAYVKTPGTDTTVEMDIAFT